jgi:hypothetical protein
MTYEQAKLLKRGDAILYRPFFGDGFPEEVKFVAIEYDRPSGDVVIVCYDSFGTHRWGRLSQYSLLPDEFK